MHKQERQEEIVLQRPHLVQKDNCLEWNESEKHFALSMDEMKRLVFRTSTGKLVGFWNLGEANDDFERLTESLNNGRNVQNSSVCGQIHVYGACAYLCAQIHVSSN